MPVNRYRHAIVCLTDATDFRKRIQRADAPIIALHKRQGQDFGVYGRLWRALRRLQPDIVHTRNLSGLEYLIPAALAGAPARVHGEHGRDMYDLYGASRKYNLLRRFMKLFVHQYVTVSVDLADWLVQAIGVSAERVTQVYNGVDIQRFHPRTGPGVSLGPEGFAPQGAVVIGTVGRMQAVKDQLTLVRAFLHLLQTNSKARAYLRLVMVGDGPLREESQTLLRAARAENLAWLPGERADIPEIMQAMDLFVLPSLAEGVSNTILEAMASGLPVVATRVGGNPELVVGGETGMLVPPANPVAMAEAMNGYLADPEKRVHHGRAGRRRVEERFSMEAMVNGYLAVYDAVLKKDRRRRTVDR
jgi:sugar transferase (PEP-CTERM/EpsH1 system associated)